MKSNVARIITAALNRAASDGLLKTADFPPVIVDTPKKEVFGDYAANIAMLLAPLEKRPPRELASLVSELIASDESVLKCEVAGPGFINIFMKPGYWHSVLRDILRKGECFGTSTLGEGRKVQVEFVSANPTGPLHIGHGRGAAVGDALANILKAAGFGVTKEFYINNVGKQVYNLGESVRLRYRELKHGEAVEFGPDHYRGDYVTEIARDYDAMLLALKGAESVKTFKDFAWEAMLDWIKKDLSAFGVEFDTWQSEQELEDGGLIKDSIEELTGKGHVKSEDGAIWLKTEELGDDKDRVLEKANGERTYFASDIAYHRKKLRDGFDTIVDIWGADHHGYEARVRASLKALGYDDSRLRIIFIQMVSLLREGEPVQMGKRAGEFVTLKQVIDEVGKDACRFFFLMRKADAHLDFDLELAKREAPENPVFYVQYGHARISSIMEHARDKGVEVAESAEGADLSMLGKGDLDLIKKLAVFEEIVEKSAEAMEPHRVTFYLQELAGAFHSYYNVNRVVSDDPALSGARLLLCRAVKTVIGNGLRLMGVSAPDKM